MERYLTLLLWSIAAGIGAWVGTGGIPWGIASFVTALTAASVTNIFYGKHNPGGIPYFNQKSKEHE